MMYHTDRIVVRQVLLGGAIGHLNSGGREFLRSLAGIGAGALLEDGMLWAAEEPEKVIPFLGTPPPNPARVTLQWDQLTSWITPSEQIFAVGHYPAPEVDVANWRPDIGGLFSKPRSFPLAALKARPYVEHNATLECSGNGPAGGLIGNAEWTRTPLSPS